MAELSFVLRLARGGGAFALDGAIPLDGVTAIVGPSGSGKTTLLSMLAGLEPAAEGEISFDGRSWMQGRFRLPPEDRRVGMVFQDGRLFGHLSVADNVGYGARRRGIAPSAVQGIIDGMGLAALVDRPVATLSGGEARRVAVARALASGPDILFMDEPLSGLDDEAKAAILPYVARAVIGSGVPVVYVTHSRAEVTLFADRILRIEAGRVRGWDRPPVLVDVAVTSAHDASVTVALGEARLTLRGQGAPGDARRVVLLPEATLLSRAAPGANSGLAALPATVTGVRPHPAGSDLTLRIAGQPVDWHLPAGSALSTPPPREGDMLWLTVLDAHLR